MSTNQSQNVQVILSVHQEFHKIREEMAKAYDQSVEEYVLNEVICGVNLDLQEPAGSVLERSAPFLGSGI